MPSAVTDVRLCPVRGEVCTGLVRVNVRLTLGMGKSNRYRAAGVGLV